MRSIARSLLPLALVLALAGCSDDDTDVKERRVVILFTTDEHSQLFATFPEQDDVPMSTTAGDGSLAGGVARRMTILRAEREAAAASGAATLTFSSGDFSQGSLASAAWVATSPELAMMSRMGYDAVALGNHEFDLGPAALAAAIQAAGTALPPLVLTNLTFSAASDADDGLAALHAAGAIAPSRVLTTSNGLRIGVVASMGVEAGTVAGAPAPVTFWSGATDEERFASVVAALQAEVNRLRVDSGVDAVILLGHGGIARHPAGLDGAMLKEDELLALKLTGVDLVLSGHSHLFTPRPRIIHGAKPVPVVQTKPYGQAVGRVELVFREGTKHNRPFLDAGRTAFLDVDDTTLPDADLLTDLYTRTVGYLESGNPAVPAYPSFLEETLSTITGTTVTDDPAVLGDLWNYELCASLDFDVVGLAAGETNALNLDADAILAAVRGVDPAACPACQFTAIGVQASGPIRGDLVPGDTGTIGFADVYHVVPLGGDPTVADPASDPNAVPGYPLVRFNIPWVALRLVYEATLQTALLQNGDFFLGASGLVVNYDYTRPRFDVDAVDPEVPATLLAPGWVTYMAVGGTPIYDVVACAAGGGFCGNPATPVMVATTLYIAGFASAFGVDLYNDVAQVVSPFDTIVERADGSHIKDFEALGAFVFEACAGNGGSLPAEYGEPVPRRVVDCPGGACPGTT